MLTNDINKLGGNKSESARQSGLLNQQQDAKVDASMLTGESQLPANWERVLDPKSKLYYYWNKHTNDTSWKKPEFNKDPDYSVSAEWKSHIHPATGQKYYVHVKTGERKTTIPSDEETSLASLVTTAASKPTATTTSSSHVRSDSDGSSSQIQTQSSRQKQQNATMQKKRKADVDPMDVLGNVAPGVSGATDKMADSTAGGALWQQRYGLFCNHLDETDCFVGVWRCRPECCTV